MHSSVFYVISTPSVGCQMDCFSSLKVCSEWFLKINSSKIHVAHLLCVIRVINRFHIILLQSFVTESLKNSSFQLQKMQFNKVKSLEGWPITKFNTQDLVHLKYTFPAWLKSKNKNAPKIRFCPYSWVIWIWIND